VSARDWAAAERVAVRVARHAQDCLWAAEAALEDLRVPDVTWTRREADKARGRQDVEAEATGFRAGEAERALYEALDYASTCVASFVARAEAGLAEARAAVKSEAPDHERKV
jgi:hypothetical protein